LLTGATLFISFAIFAFSFADELLIRLLVAPLHGETLLFLSPLGPFLFKIQIAIYTALVGAFPFWLGLLLLFVSPALSRSKRMVLSVFAGFAVLVGFASLSVTYLYFLPVTLSVLTGFAVEGTQLTLTAENYLSFCILELSVVFFVLQIPVVTTALSYARILNPNVLARNRRLAIIAITAALAILTPTTDGMTLVVVAVPAVALWEIGIAISKVVYNRANT
jgi:sec-independent protein translocase protein TatC